jgi:hypothetical protein
MPIPEDVLNQIECCLKGDGHIVHEPVVLKCGHNACRKCCSDPDVSTVKCFNCQKPYDKNELLNAPNNKAIDSIIQIHLNDLFQDLKLETIKSLNLILSI